MKASPPRRFGAGELEELAGEVVAALECQAAAAGDEFERSELAALAARVRAAGVVLVGALVSAGPDPVNAIGARIRRRRSSGPDSAADPENGQQRARTAAPRPQSPASAPARPGRTGSRPGGSRGPARRGA